MLRHRLGTDPATDVEVYTEPDERFWLGVDSSRDEEWVIIGAGSKLTSEYRLLQHRAIRRASRGSWPRAARVWSTTSSRPATGC